MKSILLAGGRGTRLRPITHTGPKQLIPIANKPVIEYALRDLKNAGITEIGVILGNKGRERIIDFLGDGSEYGVEITYIIQGDPLGLAHAAGCARDFVQDEDFVIYLGDNIFKQGVSELTESFQAGEYSAGIGLQRVENPEQFGVAELDNDGNVNRMIEKPANPPTNLAVTGIFILTSKYFDIVDELEPSSRGEFEITDAIQIFLNRGDTVDTHIVEGWWKDTGKPEDIVDANRLVLESEPGKIEGSIEGGAEITGHIDLHESATIKSGAVIRGPVSIGANTVIEDGTYIGPYTSIGANSTIKNTHIESSVVMDNATITSKRKIVDSLIGRSATIESAKNLLPEGRRLIVGENSKLKL